MVRRSRYFLGAWIPLVVSYMLALFLHAVPNATASTIPNFPYISQFDYSNANNDCGPASVAMIVRFFKGGLPSGVSSNGVLIDQLRTYATGSGTHNLDTGFSDLERAITSANSQYGLNLAYSEISNSLSPQPDAQMQAMKDAVAAGNPVIALVHGADLGRVTAYGGGSYGDHWLVVTGFSNDYQTVYVNDPDDSANPNLSGDSNWIRGGQITLPYATFRQAAYDAGSGPYGIIVANSAPPSNAPTCKISVKI